MQDQRIVVLGSGAWGTTLADLNLRRAGQERREARAVRADQPPQNARHDKCCNGIADPFVQIAVLVHEKGVGREPGHE